MSVAVGSGGFFGWRLLQRSGAQQMAAMAKSPQIVREISHLGKAGASLSSPEALVSDYRTLKLVLTAFGLEGDLRNRAFIRKVLESDLNDPRSLVNRLADKRYLKFAQTLDIGPKGRPKTPQEIAAIVEPRFLEREFERQVGEADPNLRLALNARRELAALADRKSTERTKWFEVMANRPLREVMEKALGIPPGAARAPVDRQVEMFMSAGTRRFGSAGFAAMKDPKVVEGLIESFLARSATQAATPQGGRWGNALAILSV